MGEHEGVGMCELHIVAAIAPSHLRLWKIPRSTWRCHPRSPSRLWASEMTANRPALYDTETPRRLSRISPDVNSSSFRRRSKPANRKHQCLSPLRNEWLAHEKAAMPSHDKYKPEQSGSLAYVVFSRTPPRPRLRTEGRPCSSSRLRTIHHAGRTLARCIVPSSFVHLPRLSVILPHAAQIMLAYGCPTAHGYPCS